MYMDINIIIQYVHMSLIFFLMCDLILLLIIGNVHLKIIIGNRQN